MQYGYRIIDDMCNGLEHFMDERGYNKLTDFIGMALNNIVPAEEIQRDFKIIPKIDYDKCIGCGRCYVSCFDAAHQAIDWNGEDRKPLINAWDAICVSMFVQWSIA
jgi:dihydropyrimidine dehydrogenase (NAD+) subunit PreA